MAMVLLGEGSGAEGEGQAASLSNGGAGRSTGSFTCLQTGALLPNKLMVASTLQPTLAAQSVYVLARYPIPRFETICQICKFTLLNRN